MKIVDTTFDTLSPTASINFTPDVTFAGDITAARIRIVDNKIEAYTANDSLILLANGTGSVVISGLTYPGIDGQAGQVLSTNGSGHLTWSNVVAGFTGDYNDLINKPTIPTTVFDLGITDGTANQVLKTDGAGHLSWTTITTNSLGHITVTNSTLNTTDAAITFTPLVNFSGNATVTGTVTASSFASTVAGTPTISSSTNITLEAAGTVIVSQSPFRLASFTTTERDALLAQNGDMIYNTTTNKFQGYENGAWVNLV